MLGGQAPAKGRRLGADLASVFGIELDSGTMGAPLGAAPSSAPKPPGPAAPVKPKAKAKAKAKAEPPAIVTVTAAELRLRGVPPATVGYWLKTGVLWRTPVAGVYEETERLHARLARYGAKAPA